MTAPLDVIRQSGQGQHDLREHYENAAFDMLHLLWRRRFLIGAAVLAALAVAVTLLIMLPRKYTAQALIQLDFARQDTNAVPPVAAVEAAVLAESEARLIASRAMARKVALRLHLDEAVHDDDLQASSFKRILRELRATLFPETVVRDPIERAAISIGKHLNVANVSRAYLITIGFTADSPQRAANVANAFALEFFKEKVLQNLAKREAAANQEVLRLSAIYGSKYPALVAAQSNLETIQAEARAERERDGASPSYLPPGIAFVPAQALATVSSPKGVTFLAAALGAGLALGIALVFLFERRDRGFRTAGEVYRGSGVRCAGIVPKQRGGIGPNHLLEAFRSLCLATSITNPDNVTKVVLISTPLPDERNDGFGAALADSLLKRCNRVLSIDLRLHREQAEQSTTASLSEILADSQSAQAFLEQQAEHKHTVIARGGDAAAPFLDCLLDPLERFLASARKTYDTVIIEAPPVLASCDALRLGPLADIHLHVVTWRRTPRDTVAVAIERFKQTGARVTGVVLAGVDLKRYRRFGVRDQFYYLGKYENVIARGSAASGSLISQGSQK